MDRSELGPSLAEARHHCQGDPAQHSSRRSRARPGRALDLGCGSGRDAIWLAEDGWWVTAVDFSEVALAVARRPQRGASTWNGSSRTSSSTCPSRARSTSSVVSLVGYPHRLEPRSVLARAASALVQGGLLFVLGHRVENIRISRRAPGRATRRFASTQPTTTSSRAWTASRSRRQHASCDAWRPRRARPSAVDALVLARNGGGPAGAGPRTGGQGDARSCAPIPPRGR